jgi:cytochrome d ubiquinol oxidase subunit I
MVFLGSMFSAIWIVVANSWQQTPAGFHIVGEGMEARAEITDFWAMVFNPSSVDRVNSCMDRRVSRGSFSCIKCERMVYFKEKASRDSQAIF